MVIKWLRNGELVVDWWLFGDTSDGSLMVQSPKWWENSPTIFQHSKSQVKPPIFSIKLILFSIENHPKSSFFSIKNIKIMGAIRLGERHDLNGLEAQLEFSKFLADLVKARCRGWWWLVHPCFTVGMPKVAYDSDDHNESSLNHHWISIESSFIIRWHVETSKAGWDFQLEKSHSQQLRGILGLRTQLRVPFPRGWGPCCWRVTTWCPGPNSPSFCRGFGQRWWAHTSNLDRWAVQVVGMVMVGDGWWFSPWLV